MKKKRRPSKDGITRLTLVLSERDAEKLDEIAESLDLSKSQVLRRCLLPVLQGERNVIFSLSDEIDEHVSARRRRSDA